MKVKVTKKFMDKYTGKVYEVGQEVDLTADRVKEINAVGDFIKEIKESPAKKTTAKKSKKDEPAED